MHALQQNWSTASRQNLDSCCGFGHPRRNNLDCASTTLSCLVTHCSIYNCCENWHLPSLCLSQVYFNTCSFIYDINFPCSALKWPWAVIKSSYSFACRQHWSNSNRPRNILNCIQNITTHKNDLWNQKLSATEGTLIPDKLFLVFNWLQMEEEWTMELCANDQNNRQPLTRLPPTEAIQTLGVHLAPDGNNQLQEKYY